MKVLKNSGKALITAAMIMCIIWSLGYLTEYTVYGGDQCFSIYFEFILGFAVCAWLPVIGSLLHEVYKRTLKGVGQ